MGEDERAKRTAEQGGSARASLLLSRDSRPVDLGDCYQGCCAFLIGGGPSLCDLDHSKLGLPGCLTMAMNNAPKTVRPDLWVSVDDPSCFLRSIWLDPKIMKFVPLSHASKQIFDSDRWEFLDRTAADCPNTFFYRRNNQFDAAGYLTQDSVNWGSHRRHGGGRSVMFAAVRLLHHLGVRKVFLVGVDFKMDADYTYHFEQGRHRAVIDCNRKTYGLLNERFRELLPIFEADGFEVFNCNPDSGLTAFPTISFDEAIGICREGLPEDASAERTEGLYDKRKDRGSWPRARRRLATRKEAPALQPPRVVDGAETRPHVRTRAHRYPVGCGVVVGSDVGSEWMLEWWYGNYREHNDYPVTFVDYGMSLEASRWCAERGTVKRLPGKFPTMPAAWFYKPAMFLLCEAEKVIGIDLDCEVRGPLGPVFDLIVDHPVVARDPVIFRSYRHLFRKGHYFNTGVIGAPAEDPLVLAWGRAVLSRHAEFRGDQELFNLVLYEQPGAQITELPEKFNRLRVNGDSPDAVIMHWTGPSGKREIRRQIAAAGTSAPTSGSRGTGGRGSGPPPELQGAGTVEAFVFEGLCNRINGIASALATGREVSLRWAVNEHCPVRFEEVFDPIPGVTVACDDSATYRRCRKPERICWFYPCDVLRLPRAEFRERMVLAYRTILGSMRHFDRAAAGGRTLGLVFRNHLDERHDLEPFLEACRCAIGRLSPASVHVATDSAGCKRRLLEALAGWGCAATENPCPLLREDLARSPENVFGMCRDLLSLRGCKLGVISNNTRSTIPDSLRAFGVRTFYTFDDGFHRQGGRDDLFEHEPLDHLIGVGAAAG